MTSNKIYFEVKWNRAMKISRKNRQWLKSKSNNNC